MHFRQLIKGVLIATALFFPAHAFAAEKSGPVHVKNVHAAHVVHTSKQISAVNKMDKHLKTTGKRQGLAVKHMIAATYSLPGKALAVQRGKQPSEYGTVAIKNKHAALYKGKQSTAATKKGKPTFSSHKRDQKKALVLTKKKKAGSAATVNKKILSKQDGAGAGAGGNNKIHFDKEANGITSELTHQHIHADLVKPVSNNNNQAPWKGLPDPLQILNLQNSTIFGQTSEGKGKTGKGTTCLPALLLNREFDPLFGVNRIYVSRSNDILNQWTNAPPFHPPIYSLFSKTI